MKIATCIEGIEDIVEEEVSGKKLTRGRVKFDSEVKSFRSVNDVYEILAEFKFKTLEDIGKHAIKIKPDTNGVIKVQCERSGNHKFNSVDVEKEIGNALKKNGYEFGYKNFDNIIIADVIDDLCVIGIPIKMRLNKRDYRVRISNQGVHPCLAYAMLKIAGYKKGSIILDPFCRDATILIEAAMLAPGKIYGIDFNRNNIKNAEINIKMAKTNIKTSNIDIKNIQDILDKKEVDFIVSYPIFESKRRRGNIIKRILTEFFKQAEKIVKDKLVLLSPDRTILNYNKSFKIEKEREIKMGKSHFFVFVLS